MWNSFTALLKNILLIFWESLNVLYSFENFLSVILMRSSALLKFYM
jgi:hypothetical protein